jgi:flavin-dependent thymidylate synthase
MLQPRVKLINFTPYPVETMLFGFRNMHGAVPDSMDKFLKDPAITPQLKHEFVEFLAAEPLTGGIQEFVNMVWVFKDVSRAFQQQLTRHRKAAYSIQSLRVVPKEFFASRGEYHTPENTMLPESYAAAMADIEGMYSAMLADGERTEVARGILPLNITSPITMSIDLRSLVGLISARLCNMAQGEFRDVAKHMVEEVEMKMDKELRHLFVAPCERDERCPHAITCGRFPLLDSCEGKFTKTIQRYMKS